VMGMELKELQADGSWIGANPSTPPTSFGSLAVPGEQRTYRFCAVAEGAFLLYSTAANIGFQNGFGGQLTQGLFGAVMVQPRSAEWYRSQVTHNDLDLATFNGGEPPRNISIPPIRNPPQNFASDG